MSPTKPLLLCILDGIGFNPDSLGNAVALATTPTLDTLRRESPWTLLTTHGEVVGLPAGQMGNSEVGHLTIGAGRTIRQWLTRVTAELADGTAQRTGEWSRFVKQAPSGKVHLVGLYSRGGVHSHAEHLLSAIAALVKDGVSELHLHLISDGRDVAPHSFANDLKQLLTHLPSNVRIASVIGRYFAMDRDKRWERTQKAYDLLVSGVGAQAGEDVVAWVTAQYAAGVTDEFLPAASVSGIKIATNDRVLFFNFREDRMRQLPAALTQRESEASFARPVIVAPEQVLCFTDFDPKFKLPVLFHPTHVTNTLGDTISGNGLRQLRCAETEKYPHVTFFFNAGREEQLAGEQRIMIPSPRDVATYDLKPEMSANELTGAVLKSWETDGPPALTALNFANGDMVGHTGVLPAAIKAVETVDRCLGTLLAALKKHEGRALVFADHGNAELMVDYDSNLPCTTHTKFLVPVYAVGFSGLNSLRPGGSLRDIAPSALSALGIPIPQEMTGEPLQTR